MRILSALLLLWWCMMLAACGTEGNDSAAETPADDDQADDDQTDDDTGATQDDDLDDDGGDDDISPDDDVLDDDVTDDDTAGAGPIYGYAVWPEETGPDELAEWYPFFAAMGSGLFVEVLEEWILSRDANVARILREADAAGVPAQPYIILPLEEGLYPNEANFERFFADVQAMIQWIEDESLPVQWIGVDLETPVQMVDQINQYLAEGRLLELYAFLRSHRDPAAFAQAVANYQMLVDYCHAHDLLVHVVSFPFVLDDYSDADFGLQDAFDIPLSGVAWDQVDFMVYRTMYQGYAGGLPFTSDLVYRYGRRSVEIFGKRASIFIGLVLWPGWFGGDLGYQDPAELEADIEAALAAGLRRINIFYLTGLLAKDDPPAWMNPEVGDFQPPPPDIWTTLLIEVGMPALDLLF